MFDTPPRTLRGCILRLEARFRLAGVEMPHAYRTTSGHRLSFWHGAALWLCAFSLVIALANRVPRFAGNEHSWDRAVPPQTATKLLAKDFYLLLQPPSSGVLTLPSATAFNITAKERCPLFPVFLDSRLYTRPPPASWVFSVRPCCG